LKISSAVSPCTTRTNAIPDPSGDQAGWNSAAGSLVSRVTLEPSASIAYRSVGQRNSCPGRPSQNAIVGSYAVLANTILEPSGDHDGCPSFGPSVSLIASVPSASAT